MTRVLVIEDEPAILRGLADNLKFESYDVLTAGVAKPATNCCVPAGPIW